MSLSFLVRGAGALVVVFCACGCALDPGVANLATPVPAHFKNAASAAPGWPTDGWWRTFASAELDRLVRAARASNLDAAAAQARLEQADARIKVATQPLIPSLSASSDAGQTYRGGLASGSGGRARTLSIGLSTSYELDFWGKNLSRRRSAEAGAAASDFDLSTIVITTDASVANTYFQAVALRQQIAIARDNLASAQRILEAVQARVRFGTASNLDEAQQESLVDNVRAAIPGLEIQLEQTLYALAVLLGQTPGSLRLAATSLNSLRVPGVRAGLPSGLIARRPDIARAEAQLAAARFDIQAAKAQLLPSIQLTGQGGLQSAALRSLLDPASQFYQIAAGLTQPILDAYGLQGEVEVSQGRFRELLANYHNAVLVALQEVESALVAYRKTAEQEMLQAKAVESSQRAYDISVEQLRAGIIDRTTLLNTEQTLFSAQNALVGARLARFQSVVDLVRALGGGFERSPGLDVARVP
jgi:NodT family efflux transporter outer membrane factor (OMF) lipoprotein